jgi:hypothetical protein
MHEAVGLIPSTSKNKSVTQYRYSNNTKGNDGKTEKTVKTVSPQQKISTGARGK